MTQKPGDAKADLVRDEFDKNRQKRENALLRRTIRAEMRSNPEEEENSAVIEQRALEAQRRRDSSSPPSNVRGLLAVLKILPPWQRGIFLVVLVAAMLYGGAELGHRLGWW